MLRGFLLLLLASAPSWACTCVAWPSTKGDWERSKLVFAGTVEKKVAGSHVFDFDNATIPHEDTYIRVTEAFKGVTYGEVVVLELVATSCGGYYEVGYQGLFFASGAKGGFGEGGCDRTGPLESAAADLYFLRGLPQTARGRGVVGEVRLWESPEEPSRAMAGIKVIVTGARRRWETKTNAAGLYEIHDLPPEKLGIKIEPPVPYDALESMLDLREDSGWNVDFGVVPDTRISGRVMDPEGRPMQSTCLDLYPGREDACTDKDGRYEFRGIQAGVYTVVANARGEISGTMPFGRIEYPEPVTVAAFQRVGGIDFRVPRVEKTVLIRGKLTFRDGKPVPGFSVEFNSSTGVDEGARTDDAGTFTMPVLAGHLGTVSSFFHVSREIAAQCRGLDLEFEEDDDYLELESSRVNVTGDRDATVVVTLPIPSCEAWIRRYTW